MTDAPQDPTTGDDLERFRADFGRSLLTAAREHELVQAAPSARPRRRRAAIGFATAAAAVVLVVTALPSPGDHDAPLLGASPAEAAVQELQRSLREGVLVRRAEITLRTGTTTQQETQEDWTDLATRQRHARITTDDPNVDPEYWNPSKHERFTRSATRRAPDGRVVIVHAEFKGSENISSARSPAEEVDDLLQRARDNELVVRRRIVENGGKEVLALEQQDRCYASADATAVDCAAAGGRWPEGAPAGMRPVTTFQTWWLEVGPTPRILREENGTIAHGTTERDVQYRSRYVRWDVRPATEQNLSLVRPPAFPADRFLVVDE